MKRYVHAAIYGRMLTEEEADADMRSMFGDVPYEDKAPRWYRAEDVRALLSRALQAAYLANDYQRREGGDAEIKESADLVRDIEALL